MRAAAILGGGRAARLGGASKALLIVGGARIIDRQLAVLRPLFDEIVLIANDPAPFAGIGVPVIPDRQPGKGPLAGIDAALAYFGARGGSAVVCLASDMPFLNGALLQHLRDAPPALALVPRIAGRPDPLCARYDAAFTTLASGALADDRLAMHALLAASPVTYIDELELRRLDPELRTFTNVNTPEELAVANAYDSL